MTDAEDRIYLVDDDANVRQSLARALGLRGYAVETYASAAEFLDAHDGPPSGCLLLDYGMPGMNGLELQAALAERGYDIPIIFITGHGGIPESVQAIKMGAVDFLEKPFRQSDLIARIGEALALDRQRRESRDRFAETRRRFETLTEREREVLDLMVSDPARSSSKDIARRLEISPRTVDHHRARILEKMAARSVAELVETAIVAGLVDVGNPAHGEVGGN